MSHFRIEPTLLAHGEQIGNQLLAISGEDLGDVADRIARQVERERGEGDQEGIPAIADDGFGVRPDHRQQQQQVKHRSKRRIEAVMAPEH